MKSRIFSILLLVVFVAPVVVTYTWLHYQKKMVKRSVKWKMIEGIDKEELVLFKFTEAEVNTELDWKHSKEFEYKSEMYDVVEVRIVDGVYHYYCWWDNEETKLNRQLAGLVNDVLNDDPVKDEKNNKLDRYFKSLFTTKSMLLVTTFDILENKSNYNYSFSIQPGGFEPPEHPPMFC